MKNRGPLLLLLLVLGALVGGLAVLFQLRLAQGDVFAPYSSLRSDPLGTRALHDALAQLPGLHVERSFQPIEDLPAAPARTVVFAGVRARGWHETSREEFDALDGAVRAGVRLVVAFRAEAARDAKEVAAEKKKKEEREREKKKESEEKDAPKELVSLVDLRRRWGADVKDRQLMDRGAGATRSEDPAFTDLPPQLPWRSDVYFDLDENTDWQVLYRRGTRPVLVTRKLGAGSIVLAADSYFLSNEALQNDRAPALLAWIVGPHPRVVFDETHLGMQADPGVAALARRYGLSWAFGTLLLLAALHVWRQMALFVPPADVADELALTYHPAAGLEALLRRSVPANELVAACMTEWKTTAPNADRTRLEAVLATAPKHAPAAQCYNLAVRALQRRNPGPDVTSTPPPPLSS